MSIDTLTRLKTLEQIRSQLDVRLLRGSIPWSLAGTSGDRYRANIMKRDELVTRIASAVPAYWLVDLELVYTDANRQRYELVFTRNDKTAANGDKEVWRW